MHTFNVSLTPPYNKFGLPHEDLSPKLTCMIHDSQPERRFPAVIAVPGGSYEHCSKREGEPCAARWYAQGYNGFVLEYSCGHISYPTQLLELAAAVEYIRENADALCCDGRIILCGFSAGGHLAASLAVHHGKFSKVFSESIRPDGAVLCYPVISSGEYRHQLSSDNIAHDDAIRREISLENHVSADTVPCFIWHCADDDIVPAENSLMMASALSRCGIPYELHIFPQGGHGIAMCDITTLKDNNMRYINSTAAQWFGLALDWAERLLER